jgi:hypothetical protein
MIKEIQGLLAWGYVSGPLSRDHIRAVAARECVNRPVPRRLNNIRAVAWGYVSGSLSRNDIRAVAAWECVNRSMSGGLYNDLRMSRAYESQHRPC